MNTTKQQFMELLTASIEENLTSTQIIENYGRIKNQEFTEDDLCDEIHVQEVLEDYEVKDEEIAKISILQALIEMEIEEL